MQVSKKVPIVDLNQHITCKICKGYFVDATTIIECLHTFCRSCIVKYLESNRYCPVCDVQVHKTKPLLNIRADKTLQDIVYKLVPRLYQNEMQRRRGFYEAHPEAKPSSLEQCGEASYQHLLTPEETICLTLSYHGCTNTPRYLRCPAAVSVNHLKKLIRAKYDLTNNHRVEILFNQDCLSSSLTLIDVAYIYSWKRKGPIELTYRIYECVSSKKPKLEPQVAESAPTPTNNNNWKEVQLRISENGEMSITGIQDSPSLLEIVNSDQKYKNEVVTVVDPKPAAPNAAKKELPGLKYIGKAPNTAVTSTAVNITPYVGKNPKSEDATAAKPPETTTPDKLRLESEANVPAFMNSCASLSSGTTTTVFSTINNSKCSTKSEDATPKLEESPPKPDKDDIEEKPVTKNVVVNNNVDKGTKRKSEGIAESEPIAKQPKPTILNHSLGLLNLSNNHPLKKHSKLNRNGENVKDVAKNPTSELEIISVSTTKAVTSCGKAEISFSKPSFINKNFIVPQSRPGTPILTTKPSILATKPSIIPQKVPPAYTGIKSPCYMPKTVYNPVINVPKPVASTLKPDKPKPEAKPAVTSVVTGKTSAGPPSYTATKVEAKPCTTMSSQQQQMVNLNNKMGIKSKPSTPIGYKTLRDPPKSWNSQISKANLNKPPPDPKYSDLKNVRPAKFFKMRNNMPRYLGNPASGVKPMYQVHVSPEKDKHPETGKMEKSEIRKHSIVKIDPKTLKPISEKAPETTSLSNHSSSNQLANHTGQSFSAPGLTQGQSPNAHSDLKINTSSVSIFNPLKLQSSPKNERKSPKSPHSPKPKTTGSPTGSKRDKVNLNFTPPNPFIPNLASPTMSPNQFLYPTGPPGFPPYDPRMMAAYHSLWYGQRMGFPAAPIPGLNLDLNQRKGFEMMPSPTSPKMGAMSQAGLSPQITSKLAPTTSSSLPAVSKPHNLLPAGTKASLPTKKPAKESKNEKSLETTVEKLTQSRNKEMSGKDMSNKNATEKKEKEGEKTTLERVSTQSPTEKDTKVSDSKVPEANVLEEKPPKTDSEASTGQGRLEGPPDASHSSDKGSEVEVSPSAQAKSRGGEREADGPKETPCIDRDKAKDKEKMPASDGGSKTADEAKGDEKK